MLYLRPVVGLILIAAVHSQEIIFPKNKDVIKESCITPSGAKGICVLINDCPKVAQSLDVQYPKICGYQGRIPIVCCQQDPSRVIDISPPVTNFECGRSLPVFRFRPLGASPFARRRRHAINGLEVDRNAWPWMALLQRQDRAGNHIWFCGGVLLNQQWVLTAGHCTNRFNVTLVRLGEHDFSTDADGAQHEDVGVADVVFHPGYRPPQQYHDIALIKLAKTVELRRDISPVCLPWGHEVDLPLEGNNVTVTGWGSTIGFGQPLSPFLNEIEVSIFSTDICAKSYSALFDFKETYPQNLGEESLCIGDNSDDGRIKDSCPGDSGGPAVLLWRGRYTMVGVVSLGFSCGKKEFPGIYVNVQDPEHLAWIKKVAFNP